MLAFGVVHAFLAICAAAPIPAVKEFEQSMVISPDGAALPTPWWSHSNEELPTASSSHHHSHYHNAHSGSALMNIPIPSSSSVDTRPFSTSILSSFKSPILSASTSKATSASFPLSRTVSSPSVVSSATGSTSIFFPASPTAAVFSSVTPSPSTFISSSAIPSAIKSTLTTNPSLSPSVAAYLGPHNALRARHSAQPLSWSRDLAAAAQTWANKCLWEHSSGSLGPYGENIAAGTGDFDAASAIAIWAAEESQYNPSNPVYSHYTQMVWKGTTQLGCAVASCPGLINPDVAQFHVCEYNPAGNVEGEFAYVFGYSPFRARLVGSIRVVHLVFLTGGWQPSRTKTGIIVSRRGETGFYRTDGQEPPPL